MADGRRKTTARAGQAAGRAATRRPTPRMATTAAGGTAGTTAAKAGGAANHAPSGTATGRAAGRAARRPTRRGDAAEPTPILSSWPARLAGLTAATMLVAAGMLAVLSSLPSASAGTAHDDVPEVVVRDRTAEDVTADIAGTLDSAAAPIDGEFFVEAGEPSPMTYDEALAWQDDPDMDRAALTITTDEEVAAWGERIDAYLAGTELDGYGHLFAQCAADYGVDPRLSPAISRKESGCGANCIADFNAWGWGGEGAWAEWGSWEEAIDGHVYGLAKGGYASMGPEECESYCDEEYWDGDPELNLRDEILKI